MLSAVKVANLSSLKFGLSKWKCLKRKENEMSENSVTIHSIY